MSAAQHTFNAEQGATFSRVITFSQNGTPINLTGYSAKMDVRPKAGETALISLTTVNGRITLGGALGTITLTISATDTANLTAGRAEYDLFITSGGGIATRLLYGTFQVLERVTT